MKDLVGQILLKRYFLRELIGRGGTSDVYLAWDKLRNLDLVVKVLIQKHAEKSRFLWMFKNEAKFMKKLSHDNIVPLYDFAQENEGGERIVFIVMKYIKGVDLRHLIDERKNKGQFLGLFDISQILAAVCKALSFAHRSDVLHGDIKAANILIAQGENSHIREKDVFLTDFGSSRLNLEQHGGGTPVYMAPELINGGPVTEKTDIYALGITLYEMLSGGQLPFRGDINGHGRTPRERIAWEKLNKPLPPLQQFNPGLPVSVIAVVERALSRDPKLRQISIIEVLNEFTYAWSPQSQKLETEQPWEVIKKIEKVQIETEPVVFSVGPAIIRKTTITQTRKLRVFLCHSSQDKSIVRELYQQFNAEGWIDPWIDEEKIWPGQDWDIEIERAVESADIVIVCLSNNLVSKEGYIQRELRFVLDIALTKPEESIFIIPLRLNDCQPPRRLRLWHYEDYYPKERRLRAYERLLTSLRIRASTIGIVL